MDQLNLNDKQADENQKVHDEKPCSNSSNGALVKQEAVSTAEFQKLFDDMCNSINETEIEDAPDNKPQIDQLNLNYKQADEYPKVHDEKPCSKSSNGALVKQEAVSTAEFQKLFDDMCNAIDENDGEDNADIKAIEVENSRIRNGRLEYLIKQKSRNRTEYEYVWLAFMDLECHDLVAKYEESRKPENKRYTFGFARGLKPAKILGTTDAGNTLMYLMEWEGFDLPDLVLADEANFKCPNLILEFYEKGHEMRKPTKIKKDENKKGRKPNFK